MSVQLISFMIRDDTKLTRLWVTLGFFPAVKLTLSQSKKFSICIIYFQLSSFCCQKSPCPPFLCESFFILYISLQQSSYDFFSGKKSLSPPRHSHFWLFVPQGPSLFYRTSLMDGLLSHDENQLTMGLRYGLYKLLIVSLLLQWEVVFSHKF